MWTEKPQLPCILEPADMRRMATKCSCQLKHFVEGQNLSRRLMDTFNWQYKNCHIPMISAASLRQDKVLGRGGTRGGGGDIASLDVFYLWKILSLIFIFPNDMPVLTTTKIMQCFGKHCIIFFWLFVSYPWVRYQHD